jgi:diguanylate cyclase (GGDEF)-like protein
MVNNGVLMNVKRTGWGFAVFLFGPLMIVCLLLAGRSGFESRSGLQQILPYTGLMLSGLCFGLGYLSYPRVHNSKVFVLCILTSLTTMLFLAPELIVSLEPSHLPLFILISQVNLLTVLILPPSLKYRTTKLVARAMIVAELVFAFAQEATSGRPFNIPNPMNWILVFWPLLVLVVSFITVRGEYHLGGMITGSSYFYAATLLVYMGRIPIPGSIPLLLLGVQIYLVLGVTLHLFSGMQHRVSYDPLLRIYNRNFCSRIIQEQVNLDTSPPFAVAMVDIDHFKRVNDTWGHQAGDSVLVSVAQAIQREVVSEGILCRYGGEELAVFFPEKQSRDILPLMEKVRSSIETLKVPVGKKKEVSVTVSCGISHRTKATQSIVDVIQSADRALYRAKESGRNRVQSSRIATKSRRR